MIVGASGLPLFTFLVFRPCCPDPPEDAEAAMSPRAVRWISPGEIPFHGHSSATCSPCVILSVGTYPSVVSSRVKECLEMADSLAINIR